MMTLERKQDTREKIQLGGLIKKANLDQLSTASLYGLLLEAKDRLSIDDNEKLVKQWKIQGDLALSAEQALKEKTKP